MLAVGVSWSLDGSLRDLSLVAGEVLLGVFGISSARCRSRLAEVDDSLLTAGGVESLAVDVPSRRHLRITDWHSVARTTL